MAQDPFETAHQFLGSFNGPICRADNLLTYILQAGRATFNVALINETYSSIYLFPKACLGISALRQMRKR